MEFDWLFLGVIGLVGGLISGLLGIGGGVVLVPALFFFFHFLPNFPSARLMHFVIGTSLSSMIVTTSISILLRIFQRKIDWKIVNFLIFGIVIGSVSGAYFAHLLDSDTLIRFFSVFLFVLSIYYITNIKLGFILKRKSYLPFFGYIVGSLSSLLGIGGGVITLPILDIYQLPIKQATGISSIATFCTSLIGSISFLLIGSMHQIKYSDSIGYIYLPAFIVIGMTTAITVLFGVKLSQHLSNIFLKKVFSLALMFTAITMFFKTF